MSLPNSRIKVDDRFLRKDFEVFGLSYGGLRQKRWMLGGACGEAKPEKQEQLKRRKQYGSKTYDQEPVGSASGG